MGGDGSTGTWGSWSLHSTLHVCADRTGGAAELVNEVTEILKSSGKNVHEGSVGPDAENTASRNASDTTFFYIVNGVCPDTISEYVKESESGSWKGPSGTATNCNIVVGFWTSGGGVCRTDYITKPTFHAHDSGWASASWKRYTETFSNVAEMLEKIKDGGGVAGPDAKSLAEGLLTGKGSGSSLGGGSTGTVVEGMMNAGMGESPQHWNAENYTELQEIRFTTFEIIDENPRIKTAKFKTTVDIPMMTGRVAVLITGDCNDFGGIIIKKDYDAQNLIYEYQCQGFMDRIMANPTYVVANGSKTVHELITETLASIGLPDIYLKAAEEYDIAVTDETKMLMEADKDTTETSDMLTNDNDTTKEVNKDMTSSGEEDETVNVVTKTESSTEDQKIKNTLLRKPVGIYDKETTGDFIRTLIYDYGMNLEFYGDINGIPHFEVMDLEAWQKVGWHLGPNLGLESNYKYTFDITNQVTQVGIKNVQASNGKGEMYTSKELLGINVENYIGRMGIILDNPTTKSAATADDKTKIEQIREEYQDSTGKKYNKTETFSTEGEPSCSKCAFKNGGLQPTMKKYKKTWLNKCPGCKKDGTLKDATSGNDYKSECSDCGLTFCQYCGYERKSGNYQLTELFDIDDQDTDDDTSKSSNDGSDTT